MSRQIKNIIYPLTHKDSYLFTVENFYIENRTYNFWNSKNAEVILITQYFF